MNWKAPQRPSDHAESTLVKAVLDGTFPIGSTLPGERQLAQMLGVTRPTLREALRRLERDGWFTIAHGKATVVNDFWRDGQLSVLSTLLQFPDHLPPNFVASLLEVRADLAPSYISQAVRQEPERIAALCRRGAELPDDPQAFGIFDWELHYSATIAAANPIYTLIVNGFADLYRDMAPLYFAAPAARERSRGFYNRLEALAQEGDPAGTRRVVQEMMEESIGLWPGRRNVT